MIGRNLFNIIAIQGKDPDGKWTRKPLTYRESNILKQCVIRLYREYNILSCICKPPSNLFLNLITHLVVTQYVENVFHSLNVLYEYPNYNDPLLMLSDVLSFYHISLMRTLFISICSYPFNILRNFNLIPS